MKTKIIFRKWPDKEGGQVIALFPQLAGTNDNSTCLSYQHVGQHGTATLSLCRELKLATPEQFEPLKAELERLGYVLDVRKRVTPQDHLARKQAIG